MADRKVHHLLIGGGLAAGNCGRWLREEGASGSIVLVGREADLPYNRPPCSKEFMRGEEKREETYFRQADWFAEQEIEVLTRTSVTALDPASRTATLSTKERIEFDQALIATGANVRRINVPGCDLEGIFYLRTLGNSDAIREGAAGKRVVLIGGSYIASEVAASLTELGSTCTMVMLESLTLSRGFGEQAGRFFQDRLEEHGITVHGDDELDHFEGEGGRLTRVVTKSGRQIEADVVVIGVGAAPDVSLARSAGLELGDTGGVKLDSRLRSSAPGIFAAGDIAEYESVVHGGRRLRVEHWDVAFNQGKTAALNMLGRDQPHDAVPYFFSDLSDWASLEYVGPAYDWDREIVRGSIEEARFSVWYVKGGRVGGALSVGRSDDLEHARRLIAGGEDVSQKLDQLADLSSDLETL
jgi:3-phenylpropionate/trans-cinnamate dioxygenase ferredoxin reductase component